MRPSAAITSSVSWIAAVWFAVVLAAGCGGKRDTGDTQERAPENTPAAQTPAAAKRAFRAALLLTGPISDDGWNASAHEGLVRAQNELGAATSYLESLEKSRFEEAFRGYAGEGYDLVIGHAYEFQDAAMRVAPDFPRTTFVVIAGNRAAGNVSSISFRLEEATFALGAMAALVSKSGKLGLVGGEEIPSLAPGFQGFAAGARYVRPDAQVITKYVGNWVDVTLGKEHASALIDQGVDLIFQNADKAGLGVFAAARENPGIYAFGSNKDQNGVAPEVVLASAVLDVPRAIAGVAAAVRDGRFVAGAYGVGVREGVVSVVMNPALASALPESVLARVRAIEETIASGGINVLDPSQPIPADAPAHPDWLRR
ncbi:MAG: BMP family protein [bacterium]